VPRALRHERRQTTPLLRVESRQVAARGERDLADQQQPCDRRSLADAADQRAFEARHACTVPAPPEAGCISYRVYEDAEREPEFVFVEEWRDDGALQEHFGTPHVREFMAAVPAALLGAPDVKFHTIAASRDLADVSA
jgi:quinol monooxygenase YgiN